MTHHSGERMISTILPNGTLPLGLGCSRLGSVNGASGDEAKALLSLALDEGVRFFDTSSIYAQGDSERYLGQVIGPRDDCLICSKGGKYLSLPKRLLVPFKTTLRSIVRRSASARGGVAKVRSWPLPARWEAEFLMRELEGSLRRLRREKIDIHMLHSPDAAILWRGDAVGTLESARLVGKIGLVGVSVDDPEAAGAALADPRIRVLQLPLHDGDRRYDLLIDTAAKRGVSIVAREVLSGPWAIADTVDIRGTAARRIAEVVRRNDIAMTLVGTTKADHLREAIAAASFGYNLR
ncbi:MAG: aldo/keto reductase [Cypionkella sp.]|uniref:aldo/keto reductase n=1 Tax=Cypionkella sp. TaxID=2811411 RepID=UPI002ABA301E|nr:aldo/keto reductase [Cypionkella sp.]MDZ4309658.1 aldo/keto reductase [Cypionkella sp.]